MTLTYPVLCIYVYDPNLPWYPNLPSYPRNLFKTLSYIKRIQRQNALIARLFRVLNGQLSEEEENRLAEKRAREEASLAEEQEAKTQY